MGPCLFFAGRIRASRPLLKQCQRCCLIILRLRVYLKDSGRQSTSSFPTTPWSALADWRQRQSLLCVFLRAWQLLMPWQGPPCLDGETRPCCLPEEESSEGFQAQKADRTRHGCNRNARSVSTRGLDVLPACGTNLCPSGRRQSKRVIEM